MKIVAVTPYGRRAYVEILFRYLKRFKALHKIDEWHIWNNTSRQQDLDYLREVLLKEKWIKEINAPLPEGVTRGKSECIHAFWEFAKDEDTIYVRFDDDIVWIDDDCINNLVRCKIDNPKSLIVGANVINNAVCDHLNQTHGFFKHDSFRFSNDCLSQDGWQNPHACAFKHNCFLEKLGTTPNLIEFLNFGRFPTHRRFSINTICWIGKDLKDVKIPEDEESFITEWLYSDHTFERAVICGDAVVSHFAFHTQRKTLSEYVQGLILNEYRNLSKKVRVPNPVFGAVLFLKNQIRELVHAVRERLAGRS